MAKKTIRDLKDLRGKRVFVRVDFNVPHDKEGNITNDRRIKAALPTLRHVLDNGGIAIVASHFGRPKGDPQKDAIFTMNRIAERLAQLLRRNIVKADYVVGAEVIDLARIVEPGEALLLENVRFHPGEEKNSPELAREWANLADIYVNDAFGTCHRKHASMHALPQAMRGKPRAVGFLVAKELEILEQLLSAPPRPLVGIMGGAKVSDKIGFIKSMLTLVDKLLIGGAMSYTFMKAQRQAIGSSLCEADKLDVAREVLQLGQNKIVLPTDHLVAERPEAGAPTKVVEGAIPDGWLGVDIGPKTIAAYQAEIQKAGTVVWNGPMGKFEVELFGRGTKAIAQAMAAASGVTIVGGGETAEAVEKFGLDTQMKHVSTGGGAFLEYIEGEPFAPLDEIDDL